MWQRAAGEGRDIGERFLSPRLVRTVDRSQWSPQRCPEPAAISLARLQDAAHNFSSLCAPGGAQVTDECFVPEHGLTQR